MSLSFSFYRYIFCKGEMQSGIACACVFYYVLFLASLLLAWVPFLCAICDSHLFIFFLFLFCFCALYTVSGWPG
jgi:hypothetical protein